MAATGDGITLQALVRGGRMGLRFAVRPTDVAAAIRGYHVTDLEHPARYLLPGELLLTNGLWLRRREAADWIAEVKAAAVMALAFGLTDERPDLPDSVQRSCAELGLPLIVVPAHVSFTAVTDRIEAAYVRQDPARLQLTRLRRLQQKLAGRTMHSDLLALVAQETRLDCWLIAPGGRVMAGAGPHPDVAVRRAAARAGRTGKLSGTLDSRFSGFPVDSRRGHSSLTLLLGCPQAELSDDARLVVETVTPSFFIEHAERRARAGMRGALVRELLGLVWSEGISRQAYAARLRAIEFDSDQPVTAVASTNDLADLADVADGITQRCAYASFADVNILLVQSDSPAVVDEIAALLDEGGVPPVLGAGSAAKGPSGLRRSLAQALPACGMAQSRPVGEQVVRQVEIGSYVGLLHSVDHRTSEAFRAALLAPLEAWDAEHGADLLPTLRAFLDNDGKWRQTARALHIHHNTLKYRAERICALTGRDLDSLRGRIDFALALAVTPLIEMSPTDDPKTGV